MAFDWCQCDKPTCTRCHPTSRAAVVAQKDAVATLARIREAAGPVQVGVSEWDHIEGDIGVTVPLSHLRALLQAIDGSEP
jgi:hypothetical protein